VKSQSEKGKAKSSARSYVIAAQMVHPVYMRDDCTLPT